MSEAAADDSHHSIRSRNSSSSWTSKVFPSPSPPPSPSSKSQSRTLETQDATPAEEPTEEPVITFVLGPVDRSGWSLKLLDAPIAMDADARHAVDEEARAEVEVLNSRVEKTAALNKKIAASLARLEEGGKRMQSTIGPLTSNTQGLQTLQRNIDNVLAAIDKYRKPGDVKGNEEDIMRKGPEKVGLTTYFSSLKRLNKALAELKQANVRSNQQAILDLQRTVKNGNSQLEGYFQRLLQEESTPIEPLYFITKNRPFPMLSQDTTTRLGLIVQHFASLSRQGSYNDSPLIQVYAGVRGPYMSTSLQNMASACMTTAKKISADAVYRQGTNGISSYAIGLELALLAEYDSICALFSRDEWSKVFNLTCQGAVAELARTLRDLNQHVRQNLQTDCYLAFEIVEIMSSLTSKVDSRTGELKSSFASALKPIRDTAKTCLGELLNDTQRRVQAMQVVPSDGSAVPITAEVVTRLQNMVDFLRPISSIMIGLGDGGWKNSTAMHGSAEQVPSLSSFDISADGQQLFANYCIDTIDVLISSLDNKGKQLAKTKMALAVFVANNATIVERMVRNSDLLPLLSARMADIERWRKQGAQLYTTQWRDPSAHLLDVQYTNRGARPSSGSASAVDSAAILKGLGSKDKDALKEKFRLFNASFDELVARHRALHMEREVRELLGRQVQQMIEPLYGRFWDRYHDVDKGKGKYVKYDKAGISAVFNTLV